MLESSQERLRQFRNLRKDRIERFVGGNYSEDADSEKKPVNLLELAVNTYTRQLAARTPQVSIDTIHASLKPQAANFELALNYLFGQIKFGKKLTDCVQDAFFQLGILKVGLNHSHTVELLGVLHDVGQPFVETISLDNFIMDMYAETYERCLFVGDKFRVPMWMVRESDLYDQDEVARLVSNPWRAVDEMGEEPARNISRGSMGHDEEEEVSFVDLWDIWLPHENLIITIPVDWQSNPDEGDQAEDMRIPVLRVDEWEGPEIGPYHLLGFGEVPDQIMPMSPVSLWQDMDQLANKLYNKLSSQAERQKSILAVNKGAEADGKKINDTSDGDTITVDRPEASQEISFGGIHQHNLAFMIDLFQRFSYMAGNLDALGGLGTQSDTLGQDRMLAANASKRLQDMQDRTVSFTVEVIRSLAYWIHTDPFIEIPLVKPIPGMNGEGIPVTYSSDNRDGDFLDYNFTIEPFSMQYVGPREKVEQFAYAWNTFIVPMLPMLEMQGKSIQSDELLHFLSEKLSLPELQSIIAFSPQTEPVGSGAGQQTRMAANTTRTYERVSRPGGTQQGHDNALVQSLMGTGPKSSQAAGAGRGVG